jgi:hypothetical protein
MKECKNVKETQRKETIVAVDELAAIHNQLLMTHPTGDDILSIANCIIITRQLMTMPSKREEPKKEPPEKDDPKEEPPEKDYPKEEPPKPADLPEKKQK